MKIGFAISAAVVVMAAAIAGQRSAMAGTPAPTADYKVLPPITQDNLTIFPVVASSTHDTHMFITLDDGLRSGEVVITEAGQVAPPLIRRRSTPIPRGDGAQVNRLVLVNNSDRPLLLLAGEIVTGGKQDRVVGKDRIIPPKSDPVDLSVFCVEPGRWTGVSQTFGGMGGGAFSTQMAQPSVRARAMADKSQQQVWSEVHKSAEVLGGMAASPPARAEIASTSSYARVMGSQAVTQQVDQVALPVERSYQSAIRQLREQNAVGVVVAVNGEIVWADIFASTPLLEKYWPKLVRSYAAEALTHSAHGGKATVTAAQAFLNDMSGSRELVETEPGVYRHTEIVGRGFHAFELASLLPKTGYDLHLSKMAE